MPTTLTYRIPKNTARSIAHQIAAFASCPLDQGELQFLQLEITEDNVVEGPTHLERSLTLAERVPGFESVYGGSNPDTWGLATLFTSRISAVMQTSVETG